MKNKASWVLSLGLTLGVMASPVAAQETIKLGISAPMSGAAAIWGTQSEWMCNRAVSEIKEQGGVKVGDVTYNFECIVYDNKYNAADGAKVAQTLINRDQVKFISHSIGTAPVRALQSISERKGVIMFTVAWGISLKGPKFPLTFTQMNTPFELFAPLLRYVKDQNPDVKSVVLLNPNDASGQELEPVNRKVWTDLGVEVLTSDWYERGTTEFQPIAAKLASLKPDAIDLGGTPPGVAGSIFKELELLGWKGVKVNLTGTTAEAVVATGGEAANGVYMGAAVPSEGPSVTDSQKALNAALLEATGEPVNAVIMGAYDAPFALKAAMEKAQSTDPKVVAKTIPTIVFKSFYGDAAYGGEATYGSPQQMLIPVIVTQIQDGKLVEQSRLIPEELKQRLGSN